MSRRALIGAGASSVVAFPFASALSQTAQRVGPLPRVDLHPDRIIKQVAGLRPYRPSGFVLRAEPFGEKTLIHSYGHGGCGVTLCWGVAHRAAEIALATPHRTAAVIGAGAIGLTTARMLQDRGFAVTVYARALPPETTSNIAAGIFCATSVAEPAALNGPFGAELRDASRYAWSYFQPFAGRGYGVRWMDFYMLGNTPPELSAEMAVTPEIYALTQFGPGEHPFPTPYAARFSVLIAETNIFMPRLLDDVIQHGGKIVVRGFSNRDELAGLSEGIVVNCAGLGATAFVDDPELVPVKGQLTLLRPQEDIDYCYLEPVKDLYMFPRADCIVLGGSHGHGDVSTTPDPVRAEEMYAGHAAIINGMA